MQVGRWAGRGKIPQHWEKQKGKQVKMCFLLLLLLLRLLPLGHLKLERTFNSSIRLAIFQHFPLTTKVIILAGECRHRASCHLHIYFHLYIYIYRESRERKEKDLLAFWALRFVVQ